MLFQLAENSGPFRIELAMPLGSARAALFVKDPSPKPISPNLIAYIAKLGRFQSGLPGPLGAVVGDVDCRDWVRCGGQILLDAGHRYQFPFRI